MYGHTFNHISVITHWLVYLSMFPGVSDTSITFSQTTTAFPQNHPQNNDQKSETGMIPIIMSFVNPRKIEVLKALVWHLSR